MATRDPREDWRRFDVDAIPTKESTPHLDRFLDERAAPTAGLGLLTLLDVGCGDGRVSKRMYDRGFSVMGTDISPSAVRTASELPADAGAPGQTLRFQEADFAADESLEVAGGPFDLVVCQLVVSIVGDVRHRRNLLRHLRENLRPGGWLYLSASGVSDAINPNYARLYAEDFPLTGERHSYYSRAEDGRVLYMTHHFTEHELATLLKAEGFGQVSVTVEQESSSRRPGEAAYFLYATCRR